MRRSGLVLIALVWTGAHPLAQAVPPLAEVARGPLGPRTVTPAVVACTDLPMSAAPVTPLHVIAPHAGDLHQASYRGDVVVLSGGTPQGLMVGQQFFTRRIVSANVSDALATTERGAIRTTGWLTVVAADERFALARIDFACTAIEVGDHLEPYLEPALPASVAGDGPANFSDLGRVLFGRDRREGFGAGDLLSVDRGSEKGLVNGMRVAFYRDRGIGTPLVEVGLGIVVEASATTAKVVLERATPDVKLGDYFAVRGTKED